MFRFLFLLLCFAVGASAQRPPCSGGRSYRLTARHDYRSTTCVKEREVGNVSISCRCPLKSYWSDEYAQCIRFPDLFSWATKNKPDTWLFRDYDYATGEYVLDYAKFVAGAGMRADGTYGHLYPTVEHGHVISDPVIPDMEDYEEDIYRRYHHEILMAPAKQHIPEDWLSADGQNWQNYKYTDWKDIVTLPGQRMDEMIAIDPNLNPRGPKICGIINPYESILDEFLDDYYEAIRRRDPDPVYVKAHTIASKLYDDMMKYMPYNSDIEDLKILMRDLKACAYCPSSAWLQMLPNCDKMRERVKMLNEKYDE